MIRVRQIGKSSHFMRIEMQTFDLSQAEIAYLFACLIQELHDALYANAPPRSGVPFTLANSIAPRITARDRHKLGVEPSLTALGFRGGPVLENGKALNGQPNPTSNNSNITDGVYASVDSGTSCTHRQAEHSNGGLVENSYRRAQASPKASIDNTLSVNVSDLRVGPVNRETLDELALFSQYPEDEPNRVAPDNSTTASSQTNSTTLVRRRRLVPPLRNEHTNRGNRQALVSPNSPIRPQAADVLPLSDLAGYRLHRRTSSIDLDYRSASDSYTHNSTPRDEERAHA